MQFSKPRRVSKRTQRAISINTINNGPTIKLEELNLNKFNIPALIDTGSTHSLISAESYQKIPGSFFTPVKLHMKVAGHVLKNNVIGRAYLPVEFKTKEKSTVKIMLEFLIVHSKWLRCNNGADFLMNEKILTAITPNSLILSARHRSAVVPSSLSRVSKLI